mmetsp:Transcript_14795/g.43473  ORF Transcript_14795/g.43473 Transcript_14795/m.43473 type:complete len:137 (+) Transcript_14795:568-978(+)
MSASGCEVPGRASESARATTKHRRMAGPRKQQLGMPAERQHRGRPAAGTAAAPHDVASILNRRCSESLAGRWPPEDVGVRRFGCRVKGGRVAVCGERSRNARAVGVGVGDGVGVGERCRVVGHRRRHLARVGLRLV